MDPENFLELKLGDIVEASPETEERLLAQGDFELSSILEAPPLSMDDFEHYLTARREPEEPYGIFDKDVSMCHFFADKDGEKMPADIERRNEAEGMGNAAIPNTNIRLINYSVCPQCRRESKPSPGTGRTSSPIRVADSRPCETT
jgi:hypothetical protein